MVACPFLHEPNSSRRSLIKVDALDSIRLLASCQPAVACSMGSSGWIAASVYHLLWHTCSSLPTAGQAPNGMTGSSDAVCLLQLAHMTLDVDEVSMQAMGTRKQKKRKLSCGP